MPQREMDEMRNGEERKTEDKHRRIAREREENDRRRWEEDARDPRDRDRREMERRMEREEERKRGEKERNKYEGRKMTEAAEWNKKMRQSAMEFNTIREGQERELVSIRVEHEAKLRKMMEDPDREREMRSDRSLDSLNSVADEMPAIYIESTSMKIMGNIDALADYDSQHLRALERNRPKAIENSVEPEETKELPSVVAPAEVSA